MNLTDAELARIVTIASGTITIGDAAQSGTITFHTARPATTAGAAVQVVEDPASGGQIVLEDAGTGIGLDGNGGTVTLSPGAGGVLAYLYPSGTPLATSGFTATGQAWTPQLTFAPTVGTQLTLVSNTATPAASNPIVGTLAGLPQGGTVTLTYAGSLYKCQVNYAGGDGNDLVLTAPLPAPAVSLTSDTGISSTDKITSDAALSLGGTEAGAVIEYEVNGAATWLTSYSPVEGSNSVLVRQRDSAGSQSDASAAFTFTLDTTPPAAPIVSLVSDTGASLTDAITSNPALTLTGVETGAVVQYNVNSGGWSTTYVPGADGTKSVQVRQTDVAGNVGPAATLVFTLDTVAAAPIVGLTSDTGISSTDKITSNPALKVAGVETGAVVEYAVNGGVWFDNLCAGRGWGEIGPGPADRRGRKREFGRGGDGLHAGHRGRGPGRGAGP